MSRILHVLSQRPMLTGSGVTLDALARAAGRAGHVQAAVVGIPADTPHPEIGELPAQAIHPLHFGRGALDFPVPGMSDVMPYESTRFSAMTGPQLDRYQAQWKAHLGAVIGEFKPDLIHAHHVWLLGSWLGDIAPKVPIVTHCHATGLRQMQLCPHLAGPVKAGCARNDAFAVLSSEHGHELRAALAIDDSRIHVVGAGFRRERFHRGEATSSRTRSSTSIAYAGKLSRAKGLPWLLDAFEKLSDFRSDLLLHVAGGGAGAEADALRRRMDAMGSSVISHGLLDQAGLAELLRRTAVFVLPSFYEGLPLVLAEALACGNHLVATALPGIEREMKPRFADFMELVPAPRLSGADEPVAADLPAFVDALAHALARALDRAANSDAEAADAALAHFTWEAVYQRVETVWRRLLDA